MCCRLPFFCCGCSSLVGSYVIGFLYLILSSVGVVWNSITIDQLHIVMNSRFEKRNPNLLLMDARALNAAIGFLILSSIKFLLAFLLLVGIRHKRSKLVQLWLVIDALETIFWTIAFFILMFFVVDRPSTTNKVLGTLGTIVYSAIAWYFWAVVNNFRRETTEETETHQYELLQKPVAPLLTKRR